METLPILITLMDDSVARMQLVVRAPLSSFAPSHAANAGYVQDGNEWVLDATDERIEAEIIRAAGLTPNKGWVRE